MAQSSQITDQTTAPFVAAYTAAKAGLPGGADALRDAAIARFAEIGLPTRRVEGWKYTDLRRLQRLDAEALAGMDNGATTDAVVPDAIAALDAYRIVLVDGRYAAALSATDGLPSGITALSAWLGSETAGAALGGQGARSEHGGLDALNAAMTRDGLVVDVPKGTVLDKPVVVVHAMSEAAGTRAVHPRTVVKLGEGAEIDLIEAFVGAAGAAGWTNAVLDATLGQAAHLRHVNLIDQGGDAVHTGLGTFELGRDASHRGLVVTLGGRIARTETLVRLAGSGAHCTLAGGAFVDGRRHVDHTTEITHAVPHTDSEQVFRNVVDDHGRSVFQGRVVVEVDAQKTDARQSCRNLLLSPGAEADNKPELRIFADDVKCSHGATVGDLDKEALFYLRARGIGEADARALLTRAFVAELFEMTPVDAARPIIEGMVEQWLSRK